MGDRPNILWKFEKGHLNGESKKAFWKKWGLVYLA